MPDDKKTVGFKLTQEIIDKLDDSVRIKNEQLSISGAKTTRQDYIAELIEYGYFNLLGKKDEIDEVKLVHQTVEDEVALQFKPIAKKVDYIAYHVLRMNKLMDVFMRVALGDKKEKIEKLKGTFKGYMNVTDSDEEAEQLYAQWIDKMLSDPSPFVEAVDTLLYQDEQDDNN